MTTEKIPSWIERLLLPKLSTIEGELKAINTRIDSTNERIDSLRNETKADTEGLRKEMLSKFEGMDIKIGSLDERIISLRNETKSEFAGLHYRLDSLEKRIPVIEKMAVLELKIADIEKRLAVTIE